MLAARTTPPPQAEKAHPVAPCNPPVERGRAALPVLPTGGQARARKGLVLSAPVGRLAGWTAMSSC